jgi:hypothetical protein
MKDAGWRMRRREVKPSKALAILSPAVVVLSTAAFLHLLYTSIDGLRVPGMPAWEAPPQAWESPEVASGANVGTFALERISAENLAEAASSMSGSAPRSRADAASRRYADGLGAGHFGETPAERPARGLPRSVLADGLSGPDGIAIDPRTGNVFVSEETANRIVMIDGPRRETICDGTRPLKAICRRHRDCPPLRSPEGLAFDGRGTLYAVEDVPGGRAIAFRLDKSGAVRTVEEIDIPADGSGCAWESVAVLDGGEILLAGSNAEGVGEGEGATFFQGLILYRDAEQRWWAPRSRIGASFSSVAFSKSGRFAIYSDEVAGAVGWIDLRSKDAADGVSRMVARSPENVAVLPDGTILVAEENGGLVRLDPETDRFMTLASSLGAIETALWDATRSCILVTADGAGKLLALKPDTAWAGGIDKMESVRCGEAAGVQHVPLRVPDYLKPVLKMGGMTGTDEQMDASFQQLTRTLPMIAADADTALLRPERDAEDPIEHIQFVAFDPNGLSLEGRTPNFPTSLFVFRTRSGKVIKTSLVDISVYGGNIWRGLRRRVGSMKITVPYAAGARVAENGVAFVHFVGLGRTPDMSLVLNPRSPDSSYMVIHQSDGSSDQYTLRLPPNSGIEQWVAALPARAAQPWISLMGTPGVLGGLTGGG